MISAAIFDMDGVIIDSEPIYIPIDRQIIESYGVTFDGELLKKIAGLSPVSIAAKLREWTGNDGITDQELVDLYGVKLFEALKNSPDLKLEPGLEQWLYRLKGDGVKLAVGSSSPRKQVEYVLTRFNIIEYFDTIVTTTEAGKSKPAPDIFLLAAKKLGVSPNDCFVVEDSTNGVRSAVDAGMACIGYTRCHHVAFDMTGTEFNVDAFSMENYVKLADHFKLM